MSAIDRRSRRRVPRSVQSCCSQCKRYRSRFPKFLDSLMLGNKGKYCICASWNRCSPSSRSSCVPAQMERYQKLPRQPAEVGGATTPGFLGPLPSRPSCLESSSFRRSVFGSPPLVSLGRFLGRRPFVRSTIARCRRSH